MRPALLEVEDLTVRIPSVYGSVEVVSGVDFAVHEGEFVGLVGESGCGKTLTGLAIMGLLPRQVIVDHGAVRWEGEDLLGLPARARRRLMGREMAMVYQDALSSLNPSMTVGAQLRQVLRDRRDTRTVAELLELVHLTDVEATARAYPFQLSGGQRQRVLIAMALSRRPRLLVADEPTTALDETVQARIIELLRSLQEEFEFSTILITHNIALVAKVCQRTMIMYAGQLMEDGTTRDLLRDPRLPYTKGLVDSIVSLETGLHPASSVEGIVPSPRDFGPGCRFVDRCHNAGTGCRTRAPELVPLDPARRLACYHPIGSDGNS